MQQQAGTQEDTDKAEQFSKYRGMEEKEPGDQRAGQISVPDLYAKAVRNHTAI